MLALRNLGSAIVPFWYALEGISGSFAMGILARLRLATKLA